MKELHFDDLPRSVELLRTGEGYLFRYIDERRLPGELKLVDTRDWREVVGAVKTLAVRGAPAIGVAGASALMLWAAYGRDEGCMDDVAEEIASARPTAVNLRWAINRMLAVAREANGAVDSPGENDCSSAVGQIDERSLAELFFNEAKRIEAEDEAACRAIGAHGAELIHEGARILTHCNAGSLATSFYGTALGVVYAAAEQGKVERVYADETRPVGQGARLTVWELSRVGVPTTLICDNMAASLMAAGNVDAVIVGADRIARNGDVANKIGTYGVAVLAHEHGIPFYVAAPFSTVDLSIDIGASIPIEQRDSSEVLANPIPGVDVWNPAFDVTPARYVTSIITERGVFKPGELPEADSICQDER